MASETIGVVGAGMMGSEIALVFALAGHPVLISDRNRADVEKAVTKLEAVLDKGIKRGFYTDDQKAAALANLNIVDGLDAYADCGLIIEAIFEDETAKGEIFERLDAVTAPGCILASNTSSISITVLSSYVSPERRKRFLGTHFFSPVSRMKLVEVIPGIDTDPEVADGVAARLEAIGKAPIRVKDVVGFAVNRLIHIFWIEAVRLVEEGVVSPADLDTGCKLGLGHPVGPFELMDAVTNNLTLDVQAILHEAYGDRFRPRPLLKQMVKAGYNGRRYDRGWYHYNDD